MRCVSLSLSQIDGETKDWHVICSVIRTDLPFVESLTRHFQHWIIACSVLFHQPNKDWNHRLTPLQTKEERKAKSIPSAATVVSTNLTRSICSIRREFALCSRSDSLHRSIRAINVVYRSIRPAKTTIERQIRRDVAATRVRSTLCIELAVVDEMVFDKCCLLTLKSIRSEEKKKRKGKEKMRLVIKNKAR